MQYLCRRTRLTKITIPKGLYARLIDDAKSSPALEICGLLAGREQFCSTMYPIKNISPTPETTFYMDPPSQFSTMTAMRQSDEEMVGIYHSHPTTPAIPSPRDIAGAAYADIAYLIVSLQKRANPKVSAFILTNGTFAPITLCIQGPSKS